MGNLIWIFIVFGLISNVWGLFAKDKQATKRRKNEAKILPKIEKNSNRNTFNRVKDAVKQYSTDEVSDTQLDQPKDVPTKAQRISNRQQSQNTQAEDYNLSAGVNPDGPETDLTDIEKYLQRQGKLSKGTISDDIKNMEADYDRFQLFLDEAVTELVEDTEKFVEQKSHLGEVTKRKTQGPNVPTDMYAIKQGVIMATILERQDVRNQNPYGRKKGV